MKTSALVLIFTCFLVLPAIAEKPDWAGKGKPSAEQKAAHKEAMNAKRDSEGEEKDLKEKKEKKENSALEKQKDKKSEKTQQELDKGSAKGKETRESNSKKWWKFWE